MGAETALVGKRNQMCLDSWRTKNIREKKETFCILFDKLREKKNFFLSKRKCIFAQYSQLLLDTKLHVKFLDEAHGTARAKQHQMPESATSRLMSHEIIL